MWNKNIQFSSNFFFFLGPALAPFVLSISSHLSIVFWGLRRLPLSAHREKIGKKIRFQITTTTTHVRERDTTFLAFF